MKKFHYLLYCLSTVLLFSCKNEPSINDVISCTSDVDFHHSKIIRDAKNNFEINLGEHWKRELYFDDYQSRIYAADTTRNFSSSFIIDVTRFKGKIIIEEAFKNKITTQVLATPKTYIIQNSIIKFNDQPAYAIYYFHKNEEQVTYNIQYYIADQEHYYLLSAQINGSQNFTKNNCEILQIFNSLKIIP